MKNILPILFRFYFLFVSSFIFGQNKIDSLLILIKTDIEDTNKVINLHKLCIAYQNIGDYNSALLDEQQTLELAQKIKWRKGEAKAYNSLGVINVSQGNYPKALDYYLKALKIDEELNDKNGIAMRFGNIGIVYKNQSDYPKALYYYFRALKLEEELGNKKGIARHLGNIGNINREQGNYPKALGYYLKALKLKEELGDKKEILIQLGNIGGAYLSQGDSAIAKGNTTFATVDKYAKALNYYFKSLEIAEKLGYKDGIANAFSNIGSIYIKTGKHNHAFTYLYRSLVISDSIGSKKVIGQIYAILSALYEKSNIPLLDTLGGKLLSMEQMRLRALYYHKRYISIRDTLFSEENKKQLVRKEMNFEFEKKEALTKAKTDEQASLATAEKKKQQIIIYAVAGVLLIVIIFSLLLYKRFRVTNKQKQIIEVKSKETEEQKHIIEEKNKDITDSINYARRIQNAILPDKSLIQKAIPSSFILYKPKDIVSGDFYFFHELEDSWLLAAADCTGHGIPGAFMSMIGSNTLSQIINISVNTHPSYLLKNLNDQMRTALHQRSEGSESRDGMDIALIKYNYKTKKLEYAGANRPFYIIRQGATEVEEIKATKRAIGGTTEDNQNFENHEIKFAQGDTIYISTDGYADQFSREDKKLTTKKFKQVLLEIQNKTMPEQEKHLDDFIENWKGGIEQIDDILVIGIRL